MNHVLIGKFKATESVSIDKGQILSMCLTNDSRVYLAADTGEFEYLGAVDVPECRYDDFDIMNRVALRKRKRKIAFLALASRSETLRLKAHGRVNSIPIPFCRP